MHKKTKASKVLGYYWRHVRPYKLMVLGTALSVPFTVLVNSFLPSLIVATVLSRLSRQAALHQHLSDYLPIAAVYFVILFVGIFAWRLVDYFAFTLEGYVSRDIAEEVFSHLLDETADFHANNFGGSLVSQTNKLLTGYIRIADTSFFQVFPMLMSIVYAVLILAPRAPYFAGGLVIFAAIFMTAALFASRNVRKHSTMHAASESHQTGLLADAISNVLVIKSFARKPSEIERFHKATSETQDTLHKVALAQGKLFNQMGFISRIMSTLALISAVISVVVFKDNIATVFLIMTYTGSIVDQLFNFSNSALRNYNRSIGDAYDMVKILAATPEVQDPLHAETADIGSGSIDFNHVTFTHNEADTSILSDFDLHISHGEKVGLVGHSGSGKTTLTRLLLRFSDIDDGEILIDGQNIARITQDALHEKIAYVPQEPLLFHRSIADNIAYGRHDATMKDIAIASANAHASEFIDTLPKKYKTLVGERGVKLSGGQRQRIAVARAMLKDAPILLLDEATSALDSESEVLIQDALWKLMENKTAIVIAHRLSTIQRMDRIIVLDDGNIIEQGTHKKLLAGKGTYAKLWAHQSGGFIED